MSMLETKKIVDRGNYWKKAYKDRTNNKDILSVEEVSAAERLWGGGKI